MIKLSIKKNAESKVNENFQLGSDYRENALGLDIILYSRTSLKIILLSRIIFLGLSNYLETLFNQAIKNGK